MKKLAAIIAAVGLSLCSLTGCAQSGVKTSAQATAENPMILTLAHGLSETHTVHIAMTEFADKGTYKWKNPDPDLPKRTAGI